MLFTRRENIQLVEIIAINFDDNFSRLSDCSFVSGHVSGDFQNLLTISNNREQTISAMYIAEALSVIMQCRR